MRNILQLCFSLVLIACASAAGCSQPRLAPAVQYNDSDAELLRGQLEKMDWE